MLKKEITNQYLLNNGYKYDTKGDISLSHYSIDRTI